MAVLSHHWAAAAAVIVQLDTLFYYILLAIINYLKNSFTHTSKIIICYILSDLFQILKHSPGTKADTVFLFPL